MDRFGTRIRDARLAHGLTQRDAADGVCSVQDWIDIESGMLDCPAELRAKIEAVAQPTTRSQRDQSAATAVSLEAALRQGDWQAAESLLEHAEPRSAHTMLCRALVLERRGEFRSALTELESITLHERSSSSLRLRIAAAQCRCLRYVGDLAESVHIAESTLAAVSAANSDPELVAELSSTLAGTFCETGEIQRALDLTEPAKYPVQSPWITATRLWARSMVLERAGRRSEAVDAAFETLVTLRGLDQTRTLARMQNNAAWLALQLPDADLARINEMLQDAEATLRAVNATIDLTFVLTTKAECEIRVGDVFGARQSLHEALRLMSSEDSGLRARITAAAAQLFASMGDRDEAHQHLLTARELLENSGAKRSAAAVWKQMAETYASLGQQDLQIVCLRAAMDLLDL